MSQTTEPNPWMEAFIAASALGKQAPSPAEFPEPPHLSNSYWIREFPIDFEDKWVKASAPSEVDVAIIGSGITGATAAYRLSEARPDLKVALFEARGLCTGATGRNGGHIGRPEAHAMIEMSEALGTEEALRLRRFQKRNREMMIETIEKLNAVEEVDLSLKGTLIVFEHEEERKQFLDDLEFAKKIGLETEGYAVDAEWILKKVSIDPSVAQFGGAFLEKSGTIYPRKLVALLLRTALERMKHFSVHPYTPVSRVDYDSTQQELKYKISTTKGNVRAKVVFHATNGYASHILPSLTGKDGVVGCKAHMLGIAPNLPESAVQLEGGFGYASFWHWILQRPNKGPYLYGLATAEDMDDYNDCISLEASAPVRQEMLTFLHSAFPHSFREPTQADILYDWTGIQGFTATGASIVGRPDLERRGEFVSVGHNGEGMGRCFACSTVIVEAIIAELDGKRDWQAPEWVPHSYRRNI